MAPSRIEQWSEDYLGVHTAQQNLWYNIFRLPFSITRETKLQTFQYKLIHLLITCQHVLFDMKLVDNAICLYCKETDQFIYFFLFCPKENEFWNTFFTWWNNLGNTQIPTQCECLEENILFGFQTEGGIFTVLNFCILIVNYHIYCQRIHNENGIIFFSIFQYLIELNNKLRIKRYIFNCYNRNIR